MRKQLKNGLHFLFENAPNAYSVMLGVGVRVGSKNDPDKQSGMAHLCEHLKIALCNKLIGENNLTKINIEAFTEREETFIILQCL